VVRFWNHEVLRETYSVCSAILAELGGPRWNPPPPETG
jgi:very-short-patch-repair endonuclease